MCGGGKPSAAVRELAEKKNVVESALPKTEFKVGDRVRIPEDRLQSADVRKGDLGTVTKVGATTLVVDVDEPRVPGVNGWLFNPARVEKLPHDFRVGERVRLKARGKTGTVVAARKGKHDSTRDWEWVEIDFDDGVNGAYRPDRVERVPEPLVDARTIELEAAVAHWAERAEKAEARLERIELDELTPKPVPKPRRAKIQRLFRRIVESDGSARDYGASQEHLIGEEVAGSIAAVDVVTSEIQGDTFFGTFHAPVIDVDVPVYAIPSNGPHRYALFIDKEVPADKYFALLDALADAGIVERGYADVSRKRGYSAVRPFWVDKPAA